MAWDQVVAEKARSAIDVALYSHARDFHAGASANRLAALATAEYHDRFLIELIQNAYDAHPSGSRGRVEILLMRDEGDHGTLYVANTGRPFSESNFKAICQLGLSDKPPGEGIGNKGIGFKSVLQICERPEIYSAIDEGAPSGRFDGYCFSFATDEEVLALLSGDRDEFDIVRRETAQFHLPVPLTDHPQAVQEFATRGFSTVIRLPLDRDGALRDAAAELANLRDDATPILLFLDRLGEMVVEERGTESPERAVLTRHSERLETGSDTFHLEWVDLGSAGRYLVAAAWLDEEALREVLAEAVEERELDRSWLDWDEGTWVSVAVRFDAEIDEGRFYTYLPMQVAAPLNGHVNGPFYAKLDRRDLNQDVALNRCLLDVAASASLQAASWIADHNRRDLTTAAVDFAAWDPDELERLQRALPAEAEALEGLRFLPAVSKEGPCWSELHAIYSWPQEDWQVFTQRVIAEAADVELLHSLDKARVQRIDDLHEGLFHRSMEPTGADIAEWAEAVASWGQRSRRPIRWWNRYYDELAEACKAPSALDGRSILLDAEERLQPAGSAKQEGHGPHPPIVFFPSRSSASDADDGEETSLDMPPALQRRMVFLHEDLEWLERVGNTRRTKKSRAFLEQHDLVRPYEASSLLEQVQRLLQTARSESIFRAALEFTYRVQRSRGYEQRPALPDLGLRVPTAGGWLPARDALFGAGWTGSLGPDLIRLLRLAGEDHPLAMLEQRTLLPPEEFPFRIDAGDWYPFLRRIGVGNGLPPRDPGTSLRFTGSSNRSSIPVDLPTQVASSWRRLIRQAPAAPQVKSGMYHNTTPLYVLPAQDNYEDLDEPARLRFGELLVRSMHEWPADAWEITIARQGSTNRDTFKWPTPLCTFLAEVDWVPSSPPEARDRPTLKPLASSWYFPVTPRDEESEQARPDYALLPTLDVRRALDESPAVLERLRALGMHSWIDPADAPALVSHLGEILASTGIPGAQTAHLRRAYERAWESALSHNLGDAAASAPYVIVRRSGDLEAFVVESGEELIIDDGDSELASRVLDLSSKAVLAVDPRIGHRIADLFVPQLGVRLVRTSERVVQVRGDEGIVVPDPSSPKLLDGLNWLEPFVLCVLELKSSGFRRVTQATRRRAQQVLLALRVQPVGTPMLVIGDEELPPPPSMRNAIPLPDDDNPTLAIRGDTCPETWEELLDLLPAIADMIGYPELTDAMENGFRGLGWDADPSAYEPSNESFARALRASRERVQEVTRELQGSRSDAREFLEPLVLAISDTEAHDRLLVMIDAAQSDEDLFARLSELTIARSTEELVRAVTECSTLNEARLALRIPLAALNAALRQLERPPIHYAREHKHSLASWIAQHRTELLLRIRRAYLSEFRARTSLAQYVATTNSLEALEPDPEWLDVYEEEPPDAALAGWVETWLARQLDRKVSLAEELQPRTEVRDANRDRLDRFVRDGHRVVLAWCTREAADLPATWDDLDTGATAMWSSLLSDGVVDFEVLTDERFIDELARLGYWPASMPTTLDITALGLTEEMLAEARTHEERERAERDARRRSIEFNGRRFSAMPQDLRTLAVAVSESVSEPLLDRQGRFAELANLTGGRSGASQLGGGGRSSFTPTTDLQRSAIGLVGEVIALQWLKARYPTADEECWRSSYRNVVLGGDAGDDSLGFDFEVPFRNTTYLFEVKALTGDSMQVELGETEVQTARRHANTQRYRILYIPFALDPQRVRLHVLDNPFRQESEGKYRVEGGGMRLRFRLE